MIDRELTIARQVQASILPQNTPRVAGLTVAARYRPMTAVAGDFYDFLQVDEWRLGTLVADVSGHGCLSTYRRSIWHDSICRRRSSTHAPLEAPGTRRTRSRQYGLLLGFLETSSYDDREQQLDPGDRLLLSTDGLIEAANSADDFFGLERVKAVMTSASTLPPHAAADFLLRSLDEWSGLPPHDDLTLLLVDWTP